MSWLLHIWLTRCSSAASWCQPLLFEIASARNTHPANSSTRSDLWWRTALDWKDEDIPRGFDGFHFFTRYVWSGRNSTSLWRLGEFLQAGQHKKKVQIQHVQNLCNLIVLGKYSLQLVQLWKSEALKAVRSILNALPEGGVATFYQTDVRLPGVGQVSKAFLVLQAAQMPGVRLKWHKIVHFGTVDQPTWNAAPELICWFSLVYCLWL